MATKRSVTEKRLKDLPGFDEALAGLVREKGPSSRAYPSDKIGDIIIPGLKRPPNAYYMMCLSQIYADETFEDSRRIRLVPPPRVAANDGGES